MKAYYGSRFSPNQTLTPEGYLVAHNVPIARTGWYKYLGNEIGLDSAEPVQVYRDPDEVFTDAAMASFEGKPLTDDHPPAGLTSSNSLDYAKGTVGNVRRGKGSDSDLLIADLIAYDQRLIDEIRTGKREVSSGYDCDYVPNGDGTYRQVGIVGNHVAVVAQGRAGNRVRIQDRKTFDDSKVDEEAQKAAKTYGIAEKDGGHRTPPEGYPKDREQYGDPVNFKYPIDRGHVEQASPYFNRSGEREKGDYTAEEWSKIGKRIADAANRLLHKGYEYKDGNVVDTKQTHDSKGGSTHMKLKIPSRMPASVTRAFAAMGFKQFAMDADPDEIMDAWDAMSEEERAQAEEDGKTKDATPAKDAKDDEGDRKDIEELKKQVEELKAALESSKKANDEKTAEQSLDDAIESMKDSDGEEESKTVDPDEIANDEAGPVAPPDQRTFSGFTGDAAIGRAFLKSIKPIIAAIPDEKSKKSVVDAAIASLQGGRSGRNAYATIDNANRQRAQAKQAATTEPMDQSDLGRQWAEKYNPHYKVQA